MSSEENPTKTDCGSCFGPENRAKENRYGEGMRVVSKHSEGNEIKVFSTMQLTTKAGKQMEVFVKRTKEYGIQIVR